MRGPRLDIMPLSSAHVANKPGVAHVTPLSDERVYATEPYVALPSVHTTWIWPRPSTAMFLPQLKASVEAVAVVFDRFFGPVTSGSSRVATAGAAGVAASQPRAKIANEIHRDIIRVHGARAMPARSRQTCDIGCRRNPQRRSI